MATSGVRGHGERLLLSANEVGTWGSASLRLCLLKEGETGGAAAMNACQVTPMPSSLISGRASGLNSLSVRRE